MLTPGTVAAEEEMFVAENAVGSWTAVVWVEIGLASSEVAQVALRVVDPKCPALVVMTLLVDPRCQAQAHFAQTATELGSAMAAGAAVVGQHSAFLE